MFGQYYELMEQLKDKQFTYFIGGRNYGKADFYMNYLRVLLEYYLGGSANYELFTNNCYKIYIKNDDIESYIFTLFLDTIFYENFEVRLSRMLEEYDAYMRYKYRDYERSQEQ
ncbi:MAG: hypothetical protein J6F30_06220 [Cellulosilyticum sp.]|nr:hypothetical protein [Cellulosilyticum sp.]